jgi:hypothetical protein
MVFFTVVIHVLLFALCAGAIISVLVYVPLFIYTIPYTWHLGEQHEKVEKSIFQATKNATAYYNQKKLAKKEPKV